METVIVGGVVGDSGVINEQCVFFGRIAIRPYMETDIVGGVAAGQLGWRSW
ncbi:MAG: hypothetical protein ACI308_00115 [Muribaculaceae bacterium]